MLREHGEPDGYAWGGGLILYPGFSLVENSVKAKDWSQRLGKQMNEVIVESDFKMTLVFHSWTIKKINKQSDLLYYLIHTDV